MAVEWEMFARMAALIFSGGAVLLDLKTARVSNIWILAGTGLAVFCQIITRENLTITGIFVPLVFLFPFFLFRMIGAADVKIFCVFGLFMGAQGVLTCMLWTFLFAAVLSAAVMLDDGSVAERFSYLRGYILRIVLGICRYSGGEEDDESLFPRYMRAGAHRENIHMTVPMLAGVLLWIGGLY